MNKKIHQVREYMTKAPQSINPNLALNEAKKLMKEYHVRHLPVVSQGKVVGLLSERTLNMALQLKHQESYTVSEIMSEQPYSVSPHTALDEVISVMTEEKYGSVIIEEDGKLVGIFTTTDACRVLYQYLAKEATS